MEPEPRRLSITSGVNALGGMALPSYDDKKHEFGTLKASLPSIGSKVTSPKSSRFYRGLRVSGLGINRV